MFNEAFDILNSRSEQFFGAKKAICKENFQEINNFSRTFIDYIKHLKIKDNNGQFIPILNSNRKTGVIGFIICLTSTIELYDSLVKVDKRKSIKLYNLSQDHFELFFGNIRAQNGYNNNPTASFVLHIENLS